MPREDDDLIFNYILLSILKDKFSKETELDDFNKKLLRQIRKEYQFVNQQMYKKDIQVYKPVWDYDGEYLDYPYKYQGIEDKQRFWKEGLKMHVKSKLVEVMNRIK